MGWGFATLVECADAWWNEYREYAQKNVSPITYVGNGDPLMQKFNLTMTNGHFTAMANAETEKLGCGLVRDMDVVDNHVLYVCNYHPPGNIYTFRRSTREPYFLPAYRVVSKDLLYCIIDV